MSRTYNHRPRWVKLNDPKFPSIERHQHHVVKSEKIGERKYIRTPASVARDEYGKVVWRQEEYSWKVPVYRRWTENVPCTIDMPEVSWMHARQKARNGDREKLCDKRELIWSCPCCTRRDKKQMYSRAMRGKVNQQLHSAVRDYGWTTEADEWYDVDITEKHKSYNEWWD